MMSMLGARGRLSVLPQAQTNAICGAWEHMCALLSRQKDILKRVRCKKEELERERERERETCICKCTAIA